LVVKGEVDLLHSVKQTGFVIVALIAQLLLSAVVHAGLSYEITQGRDNPTKIAISPLAWSGAFLPEDMSEIVENDLNRSGLFKTIPRSDMLGFPASVDVVHYRDWRMLGTEYLLVGKVEPKANQGLSITFSLMNVSAQKTVFTKRVEGDQRRIRNMAHYISDHIYKAITGNEGAFSTQILYITAKNNGPAKYIYRLMLADADGARERLILESKEPIMSPAWSPDGNQVLYVSFETGRSAIYRQELSTGKREQLTNFKGINSAPAWSPDGTQLAMTLSKDGNSEIYSLNLRTRKFTRLTNHFAIDTEPNWMPDGQHIIFTSDRGGNPNIYKLNVATKKVKRLTYKGNYNARPRLAPDGRTLVMVHRDNGDFHIATQDLITNRLIVLTKTQLDESPTVAPNGAMVLYATKHNGQGVLAAVSIDAGVRFYLPSKLGAVREPAWSPFLK
jgi:TolB protein